MILRQSGTFGDQGAVEVRIRGKFNSYEKKSGNVLMSFDEQAAEQRKREEFKRAQQRLRQLEQIEVYREKRVKAQIEEIEEQKVKNEELLRKKFEQDKKRQRYF